MVSASAEVGGRPPHVDARVKPFVAEQRGVRHRARRRGRVARPRQAIGSQLGATQTCRYPMVERRPSLSGTIHKMRGLVVAVVLMLIGACGSASSSKEPALVAPPPAYGSESGVVSSVSDASGNWAGGFTLRDGANVTYPARAVIARVDERSPDRFRAAEVRVGDRVEVWAYEDLLMTPPLYHAEYVLVRSPASE